MRKSQIKELRSKQIGELSVMLKELRGKLAQLQVSHNAKKSQNVAILGKTRKETAGLLTIIREKELAIS